MIERSRVRIPAGTAGEFSSPGSTFCGGGGRCMDVKVYDENRDNSDSENRDNCT